METLLYNTLTKNYKDVTSYPLSNLAYEKQWSKIYGAGVILYQVSDKSYMGTYRATIDGAAWGTFTQTTFNQPDPAELDARAWIDAHTSAVVPVTPVTNVYSNTDASKTTTTTTSTISPITIIVAIVAFLIVIAVLWPRRKTVFDQRRRK